MSDNHKRGQGNEDLASNEISGVHYPRVKMVTGAAGTANDVSTTNPLPIGNSNLISTNNSTSTPLGADATYTGTGEDVSTYSSVSIQIYVSHASATNGFSIEFSTDNTNWDEKHTATLTADNERVFVFPIHAQYLRVVLTNGATPQTAVRLQTIYHTQPLTGSAHGLDESVPPDDVGFLARTVLISQAAGTGNFVPNQSTAAGNLKISLQEASDGMDIGAGNAGTETLRVSISTDDVNLSELSGNLVAHDSVDSGNPNKLGAKAETSLSGVTLVADGDRTDLYAGVDGILIARPHTNLEDIVSGNASNTDGTSTQVIAAAGAGIKQYLTSATLTNTSATDTYCELKSATIVKWTVPVPANGGAVLTWDPPLPPNDANEAWNFDMGAAVTTAYCSMVGFKSKV